MTCDNCIHKEVCSNAYVGPDEVMIHCKHYELKIQHGTWEYYSHTMMECSICKRHVARHKFEYCPHCGARMDKE